MDEWDLYFSCLAGWILHPGYNRQDTSRPTLEEVADLADQMVELKNGRMGRGRGRRDEHSGLAAQ